MLKRLLPVIAAFAVSSANAQVIETMAPPVPEKPGWMCLAQVPAGNTDIHAWRRLDIKGKLTSEGAAWVELPAKRLVPEVALSIEWRASDHGKLKFGNGVVLFDYIATVPHARPEEFRMVGTQSDAFGAFATLPSADINDYDLVTQFKLSDWKTAGKGP